MGAQIHRSAVENPHLAGPRPRPGPPGGRRSAFGRDELVGIPRTTLGTGLARTGRERPRNSRIAPCGGGAEKNYDGPVGRNSCGGTTTALGQLQAASQNSLLGHVQLQRSRGCQAQRRCRVAPRSADARDGHGQGGRQLWSRGLVLSALDHGALLHARSRQMHVFCTRPNWRDADERGSRHRVQHIEPHQPCPGRE